MSLVVYRPHSMPKGIEVCENPEKLFDERTLIPDCQFARNILAETMAAEYYSPEFMRCSMGRGMEIVSKEGLYDVAKIALDVFTYPEMCFDLVECWGNVLKDILLLDRGRVIYWHRPMNLCKETKCDILVNEKYPCKTMGEFIDVIDKVI